MCADKLYGEAYWIGVAHFRNNKIGNPFSPETTPELYGAWKRGFEDAKKNEDALISYKAKE